MTRTETLAEGVTCILGDCREVLPTLGKVDCIISDPPYGQKQNTNVVHAGGVRVVTPPGCGARAALNAARARTTGALHSVGLATVWPDEIFGDDEPFDPALCLRIADRVLLWGAHKFSDRLSSGSWLVWDKVPTGKVRDQGDGEAAWINDDPPRPLRIFRLLWDGVCVGSAARNEVTAGQSRVHPTQKPLALMDWCFEQMRVSARATVCDPYMGSGSTGVVAVRRGHPFVGIEYEPLYFETACRRISEALKQPDMFIEKPKPAKQEAFL